MVQGFRIKCFWIWGLDSWGQGLDSGGQGLHSVGQDVGCRVQGEG